MPREKINWLELTSEDVQRRESALSTLLEQMDVPSMRRDTTSPRNLWWLNRNLAINNGDHPMFGTARELLTWLLRWHDRQARGDK